MLLVGDGGVGKSTLLDAFKFKRYFEHKVTIGLSHAVCTVNLGGSERYKLSIFDFSGQPRFFRMIKAVPTLMRGADGAIVAFDLSSFSTLLTAREWIAIIREVSGDIPIVLVGTKADLEREVGENDVKELMEKLGLEVYVETSAKLLKNVDEPFKVITKMILERSRNR